jgi:aspartyl-tRNA(Asn)/glutamyl-tRNA(Gln) amidotransferase subunit A
MFVSHVPTADAEAVTRMRQAGAILVGKTATHEFGWGITCANPHFGATRNPWGADRIPGGSSGGSAAAVAAGVVPMALGTDTAGSTRIPASFCGIVGLKPTFGLVDTRGQCPLAPSFDHVGVLARTPGDVRIALEVLAQRPTRAETPPARSIGVCRDLHGAPLAAEVEDALAATIDVLTSLGADVGEASVPGAASPYETFATIQLYEALKVHRAWQLYPERRSEYGPDVRERLDLAARVDEHAHRAASEQRRALADSFDRLFRDIDVLLVPTAAITAPPLDNSETLPLRELVLPYTAPMNLLGLPACALRAGFDGDGMPVGVQLVGPRGSDGQVLALAARLYEATRDTQERRPANVRTGVVR